MHQYAWRPTVLLLFLSLGAAPAGAQTTAVPQPRDTRPEAAAPVGTASVSGTVVVAGSGQPARRARVNLSGNEVRGSMAKTTDAQGRFAFTKLPPGRYSLSVSKAGHVSASYGQHRPGAGRPGTPIQLADGQRFEARLQLPRGGAITGTVLDEHAEATPGIPVRAMRYVMQNGQRTLQSAGNGTTDDRGIFRIFGLQPGSYVVCATPRAAATGEAERMMAEVEAMRRAAESAAQRDASEARALIDRVTLLQSQLNDEGQATGYSPICFPGSPTTANASAITLGIGEEKGGVDFQLQLVPLARLEGTVMNPSGAQLQNLQVTLMQDGDLPSMDTRSARPSADGRFTMSGIPPGQYTLVARATVGPPPNQRTAQVAGQPVQLRVTEARAAEQVRLWSTMDISIDGRNLTNVMLSLQPGMTMSGQIVFDGTTQQPPADLTRARVNLTPVNASGPMREIASNTSGRVDAAGRFTISNVVPGKYRLSGSSGGNGWFVESAVVAGQDTMDFPIDIRPNQNVTGASITFTDRQTEFSGTAINERNEPVSDYTIVVYAADPRYWIGQSRRIQTIRPATDGRFTFRNLPPGDYRLATVFDPEPGAWFDPTYLQQLETSSTRLTLSAGEKKVQDVRIAR
jgi:Carboxypeptidase regulatory-like domain